jgi:hypothetical protein
MGLAISGDKEVLHKPFRLIQDSGQSNAAPTLVQPDFANFKNTRFHHAHGSIGEGRHGTFDGLGSF